MPNRPAAAQKRPRPSGLAVRLRNLRVAAGLSGKGLADSLGWTPHKVSKVERGRQLIKADEVRAWVEACGQGDDTELIDVLVRLLTSARSASPSHGEMMAALGIADQQRFCNQMIEDSTSVAWFEPARVPGLVQTDAYAGQMLAGAAARHGVDTTKVAEAVAVRAARFQMVYATPSKFTILIAEPGLWWRPYRMPGPVMVTQMERLLPLLELDGLRFGIVPLDADLEAGLPDAFVLYDDELIVEGWTGDDEDQSELGQFQRAAEWLAKVAVYGDEARALIQRAIEQHRTQT